MISVPTKAVRIKTVAYCNKTLCIRRSPSLSGRSRRARRPRASAVGAWLIAPSRATVTPITTSSFQSGASWPFAPKSASSFKHVVRVHEARVRAHLGRRIRHARRCARRGAPRPRRPWSTRQLPPPSAAMSMTSEPSPIASTMAVVTRIGDLRPGTAAVVMTTSEFGDLAEQRRLLLQCARRR